MIYSFSRLPFADATAISYTQAGYIVAFSVLILGETVAWQRWAAAAIGIAGALLIAKPAFADWLYQRAACVGRLCAACPRHFRGLLQRAKRQPPDPTLEKPCTHAVDAPGQTCLCCG